LRFAGARAINDSMQHTLLSLGHGYTARALAKLLRPDGWKITGTIRPRDGKAEPGSAITETVFWPGTPLAAPISSASHILVSIAPTAAGDPVLAELRTELAKAATHLRWVGYLSTTAVYGDHKGGWVDEATPLTPTTERGKWRVNAEQQWQNLACETGLPLHIFRLAGIYGPGRGPFAKLRNGTARRIIKPDQVFSRIHVADLARVLAASMQNPNPGSVYNVCDDTPAPPEDVIAHAARLLGLPVPAAEAFETAEMTDMARSFYAESKRVSNERIKTELGIDLLYPDYQSGLKSLI